jgi:tripartite-type tricarboxylate transporter receptor subunit TctC
MTKHLLLAVIGLIGCAASANAQTFPTRPVSIIVTSAAGGAADATARAVAGQLAKSWN